MLYKYFQSVSLPLNFYFNKIKFFLQNFIWIIQVKKWINYKIVWLIKPDSKNTDSNSQCGYFLWIYKLYDFVCKYIYKYVLYMCSIIYIISL